MPYVECESLQERVDREEGLPLEDILRIGIEVARGLAAAHDQGLVHRDVKPANILLEEDTDRVLLTDFGLARAIDDAALTRSGVIAGTPQYMSPEQAKGEAIDHRTDLFSLGSVLYAMCTGHPPFRAETTMGVLRRICDGTSIPLRESNATIPEWLIAIIDKLLEKASVDRYENAGEVGALLEDCLAHVQHPTSAPLPASLQTRRTGRDWKVFRLGAAVCCVCVLLTLLLASRNTVPDDPSDDASDTRAFGSPEAPNSGALSTEYSVPSSQGDRSSPTTEYSVPRDQSHVLNSGQAAADADSVWYDGIEADFYEIEFNLLRIEATDF